MAIKKDGTIIIDSLIDTKGIDKGAGNLKLNDAPFLAGHSTLWCFYRANANPRYLGFVVSSYEGGGYSETKENEKRDKREHKEITKKYMSRKELFLYKGFMIITLQPVRKKIANSPALSGMYEKIKGKLR